MVDRADEIAYWEGQMTSATNKLRQSSTDTAGTQMSTEDAVGIIQRHERARQGRLRAKLMLEIRRQEQAEKNKGKTIGKNYFSNRFFGFPL